MLIISPLASPAEFYVIPREWIEAGTTIEITDLDTNIVTNYPAGTFSYIKDAYYNGITITFNPVLNEQTFYRIEIKTGGETIYRDLIFSTEQNVANFQTDYEQYTPQESTNEYIILDN